jgi:WhiB family redox-sensing transcriptional regulator
MDDVFMLNGLCAETDPEAFFPEKGDNPGLAKLICSRCDVRTECLEWALRKDERYGVWGGTSENDRRKLRKIARAQS